MIIRILGQLKVQLLITGCLLAVWVWIFAPTQSVQWLFFLVLIVITGIPHGSLDFYVEQSQAKIAHTHFSVTRFFVRYLLNMFLYACCWYWFPLVAFVGFIGLTAYHFGEIDWPFHQPGKMNILLFFSMGLFFIVFTITSHISETAPMLATLVGNTIQEKHWLLFGPLLWAGATGGIALMLLLVPFYLFSRGVKVSAIAGWVIQTAGWCTFIYAMPLFIGFAFYFGVWHSLLSFNLIRNQLSLPPTYAGWLQLSKKALPFSLLAFFGIGILVYFQLSRWQLSSSLVYIFMGIAILTLPHLQVFTRLVSFVHTNASREKNVQ
jgi:Brp/Blh family beta-carotene 15,15'-monooxygenase